MFKTNLPGYGRPVLQQLKSTLSTLQHHHNELSKQSLLHSNLPKSAQMIQLLEFTTRVEIAQQNILSTLSPQLQSKLTQFSQQVHNKTFTKYQTQARRRYMSGTTKSTKQILSLPLSSSSSASSKFNQVYYQRRKFSTTPPIREGPLIKPTNSPYGFSAQFPPSKIPIPQSKKIIEQTPEFYTDLRPAIGSHPSMRQYAEAEAYAVPTPPEKIAQVKKIHKTRGILWAFTSSLFWASLIWLGASTFSFLRLEYLRSTCLSNFVHLYFPQDLLSNVDDIGYLENYNNLLIEHIITAIRGVYTAKVHPELVPPWIRDMVTKDGELMDPLQDQPFEALLELCDVLIASHGMGHLTTVYTQFHEMYLQRQLKQGGVPPGWSLLSFIYEKLRQRGWDGTIEQYDAFETLSQYEMECDLCLPLVREQLHKHITSLLVPPQEAPAPSAAVQYLKSVVDFFTASSSSSSPLPSSSTPTDASSTSTTTNNNNNNNNNTTNHSISSSTHNNTTTLSSSQHNAMLTPTTSHIFDHNDWEITKNPQFNKIKSIIHSLYREAPLSSLIKQRRNKLEPLYIREQIPFTATLNETHHQLQLGRYQTLQFILNTLRSYETNLIATPHKLQQYAGDNQVIMALDDVRLLIEYCQHTMDKVNLLVEKYRTPVSEQVTKQMCDDIPIIGWLLSHESTTVSIFFAQREKLVLNHFLQLDDITSSNPPQPSPSMLPNTWSSLATLSPTYRRTQLELRPNDTGVIGLDPVLQQDYVSMVQKLQFDGSLSQWGEKSAFKRQDIPSSIELVDMSHVVEPEWYVRGDKLVIPIVDPVNPLKTQYYTDADIDTGFTGVINSVCSFIGFGKPFGKTVESQLQSIPIEDALEQGYITKKQYDKIIQQNHQKQVQGLTPRGTGTGFVDISHTNPTNSGNIAITINPSPRGQVSNNNTNPNQSQPESKVITLKP